MIRRFFSSDEVAPDLGLLIVRLGVGLSMAIFHGWGKISGGPENWERIGTAMGNVNINASPVFFGFMAGFAEFVCSCFLILGVLFRPATLLLAFTMFVAVMKHLSMPADNPNAGWSGASHAIELGALYLCLFFTGPGKYSFTMRK